MRILKNKELAIIFLLCLFSVFAQPVFEAKGQDYIYEFKEKPDTSMSRPVTGTYSIELGGAEVLAIYLSPLKYKGKRLGVSGTWTKAMPFNPRHAIMEFNGALNFNRLLNPAKTASMIGLIASFSWDMSWRTQLPWSLQVSAGGGIGIEGGAYYLIRNSNNPVQALANLSLDICGSISRPFRIGKLPVLVSEKIRIPSLGVFFCPGYGETYYEIYLRNYKGLAHAGWWGNNFRINSLLSATLDFGRTSLTLGYRFEAYTQWANNLNTKIFTNSFVIGVVPGGIGLKKRPVRLPEETIYAIY